jgi:hypothetical protein
MILIVTPDNMVNIGYFDNCSKLSIYGCFANNCNFGYCNSRATIANSQSNKKRIKTAKKCQKSVSKSIMECSKRAL